MSPLKCTYVHFFYKGTFVSNQSLCAFFFFFEELNFLKDFAAKIWSNYFKVLT